jgi:quinol monooxygenase YgiN
MVLFRARIRPLPERRDQVVRSLSRIVGPTRAITGCVSCHLYADLQDDDDSVLLTEEWCDERSLVDYLKEDSVRVLLSALEYSADPPEVRFETVTETKGIEFIAACRLGPQE